MYRLYGKKSILVLITDSREINDRNFLGIYFCCSVFIFLPIISVIILWLSALLAATTPLFCVSFSGEPSTDVIVPPASVTMSDAAA